MVWKTLEVTVHRAVFIRRQNYFRGLISCLHTQHSPFNTNDELEMFHLQQRELNAAIIPAGHSLLPCFS